MVSHGVQTNRVAILTAPNGPRRPASKIVPIIPDRPQFLSCGFLQKTAQNTEASFPEQVIQGRESIQKEEN